MLSASSSVSTVSATTTGSLGVSLNGLVATLSLPGVSTYTYGATVYFGEGVTGIIYTGSIAGVNGLTVHLPHWGMAYGLIVLQGTVDAVNAAMAYAGNPAGGFIIASAQFSTAAYVPGAPVITVVTPGMNSIAFGWSAVSNATSYNVLLNGSVIASTTGTSYTFGNLSPATQYSIGVQAVAPDVV
ncbi:MAG: fibronectin type III domain-containing protein [Patescibacteria group bacterium]|nr:fibronectin type III domain-containing protein [Patescibacteria group bacterium]